MGVCWSERNSPVNKDIYFTRVSAAGAEIGSDVRITSAANGCYPSLVWAASEFGVSWEDARNGDNEIYFTRISDQGMKTGGDQRISWATGDSEKSSLAFTGSEYGVSWADERDEDDVIYFAVIGIDEDGDGLNAADETAAGTDPNDPDSDDDGLGDGDEVKIYSTNPLSQDTDSDSLTDYFEIFTTGTDPLVTDCDGDGIVDGYEVEIYGTNPFGADTDGDGFSDYEEIYLYNTNPFEYDTDGDGLSDLFEIFTTETNPSLADTDGDGIMDGQDTDSFPDDSDGDGMPDQWEDWYWCVSNYSYDANHDDDFDGLVHIEEYQNGTNPCVSDTDGDSLSDGYEINTSLTDPKAADQDGDGLNDGEELSNMTDPLDPDSDNDGYSDKAEVDDGTDPLSPMSYPEPTSHLINYQGRLMDNLGVAVNGSVDMAFGLFNVVSGGTEIWTETHNGVVLQNGIYNILLGDVTPLAPEIFTDNELFLEVTVGAEVLAPRKRITSVPYAV